MDIQQLIKSAQDRIRETVTKAGINRVYVAFSGGKDSQAVLRLTRDLYPNILVIHNGHTGEKIGNEEGVLSVKEPKAVNVPAFLKTVDITSQIDGTRRDEDKTVIFDGVEIHRSAMPAAITENGVFGLRCCFPLFDWTEAEVFEYLRETEPVLFTDVRYSFEGEGPLIGTKTFFLRYSKSPFQGAGLINESQARDAAKNVSAVFVTADTLTPRLGAWAATLSTELTFEVPQASFRDLKLPNVRYFVVCDEMDFKVPQLPNLFIKIRILDANDFVSKLALANKFADIGHQVLLMPEYPVSNPGELGQHMKQAFNQIRPGVRLMPPIQNLLGID